jgi:galactonate dehydratase
VKITDIKTFVVDNPAGLGGRYFLFVKLTTDSGVVGYGEAYNAMFGPHITARMIEDCAERYLIGHDPHDIETFFRRAHGSGFSQRPDVSMMGCVSALEMACWDIIGKEADKPVYKLLGGRVHERLRSYTYLYPHKGSVVPAELTGKSVYDDPDLAAECAALYVEQGFTAVKLDPAGPWGVFDGRQPRLIDIELSAAMLKAIRAAVGTRADILFGTHGQFTSSGALRMAAAIEPYDPLWFEEPVPPEMPEEMALVARGTRIPVATGERLATKWEFARVIELRAASILQPDLGRSGGILETKKIAAMAEAHHIQIAPHCYCGPIVAAANIQLATTLPNFLVIEAIKDWGGMHAQLLKKKIGFEDGFTIPPSEPGLGVELNEAMCESLPYSGTQLHLEPYPSPLI